MKVLVVSLMLLYCCGVESMKMDTTNDNSSEEETEIAMRANDKASEEKKDNIGMSLDYKTSDPPKIHTDITSETLPPHANRKRAVNDLDSNTAIKTYKVLNVDELVKYLSSLMTRYHDNEVVLTKFNQTLHDITITVNKDIASEVLPHEHVIHKRATRRSNLNNKRSALVDLQAGSDIRTYKVLSGDEVVKYIASLMARYQDNEVVLMKLNQTLQDLAFTANIGRPVKRDGGPDAASNIHLELPTILFCAALGAFFM